jgi:hypothetical protein
MIWVAGFLDVAKAQMNMITNCCAETPGTGGAFFKIPLGLEVDTLRLGWLRIGGGTEDICQLQSFRCVMKMMGLQ